MTHPRLRPDPMSIKAMLRKMDLPLGGAVRANYTRLIDDLLWTFWLSAIADTGDAEEATLLTWKMVARDPSYTHPLWLSQTFKRHGAAIVQSHHEGAFRS